MNRVTQWQFCDSCSKRIIPMKKIAFALLLLGYWIPAQAQVSENALHVLNPQRTWDVRGGTIEEAAISVRPKGVYAEVGVYLTFSARGAGFAAGEVLEVEFFFSVPDGVAVTDSWLWVGDEIVRAQLIDRWTATETYEGIVNRQRDPSLLIKHDQNNYELRVYPMAGNSSRRVKLTYLVPMQWNADRVHAQLPFDWLQLSANPLETLNLLTWPNQTWQNAYVTEDPDIPVQHFEDEDFGAYDRIDISGDKIDKLGSLSFDAPLKDGLFVSTFDTEEDDYYQLAYLPAAFSDQEAAQKKVVMLFDYDATHTTLSGTELLEAARRVMKTSLKSTDQFNVLLSQVETRRASDEWLPATSEVIDSVFTALTADALASYSNLPSLIANGISFLDDHGGAGSLVLISSSDAFSNADVANRLIADLEAIRDPIPPMLIADVANNGLSAVDINSRFYEGNGYLYTNLARMTGGQFSSIRTEISYEVMLSALLAGAIGSVQAFDLHTTLSNGFTYARFSSPATTDAIPLNRAVTQIGKYFGDVPFTVQASGILQGEPFSNTQVHDAENLVDVDSTLRAYWTGRQISTLEQSAPDDLTIAEIISYSLDTRVMSLYTAFLALEPGINNQEPCGDECEDETQVLTSEDEVPADHTVYLEAYPNPFSERVLIKITLPAPVDLEQTTFQIFNTMGQVVKTLKPVSVSGRIVEVEWDGTTEAGMPASSGVYFFVMVSPHGRHTLKLVLVR